MNYLLVAIGGALGSVCRYGTAMLLSKVVVVPFGVPIATIIVNAVGSFLIGLLMAYFESESERLSYFYYLSVVGFCGGFTTFSAFSLESIKIIEKNLLSGLLYMLMMILVCVLSIWGGIVFFKLCK